MWQWASRRSDTLRYFERCSVNPSHIYELQDVCTYTALPFGLIRLGQLARLIPSASKKMLIQDLRTLKADRIIARKDLSDLVLHIEYDLDDGGGLRSLGLLGAMGDFYLGTIGSEQK
jgi:HxlR-like helix-turn-helix